MTHHRLSKMSLLTIAAVCVASSVHAQGTLSEGDRDFIEKAAEGGHAEIAAGQEAAGSENAAVRDFGNQMIHEHTQMNQELASLAQAKGVTPPASADVVSQAKGAAMDVLPGKTFDSAYVSQQLSDHQTTLELLQAQARSGQDPELKAFASKYIPVVQEHIGELQELQKRPELQ